MFATYLRLIRWPNLLIIGLIFLLAKTQLVDGLTELSGIESCVDNLYWFLLALATMFIAASGNVVNDIFDQDIDFHNKPSEIIVGNTVSEATSWNLYYGLASAGLVVGMVLCWGMGNLSNSLIFMLAAGGLYFYSHTYKRQFLIGNLVIALLAGLVPFLPLYLEMICEPSQWSSVPWAGFLMAFSVFSFLTTLIREIIKDMEDVKGDTLVRCNTVPIAIGMKGAKALVVALLLLLMGLVGWLQVAWLSERMLLSLYFLIAVQIPAVYLVFLVIKGEGKPSFKRASLISKIIMLTGILSMIVFKITLS